MNARRLPVATAVLAIAVLGLTACGPKEAAPATVPSLTATATATATASATATPTASAKPSAPAASKSATKAGATPADCKANAAQVGRVIEAAEVGYATHVWMKAKETKFVCGPDVPGESYFEGTGAVKVFEFSNDVKTYVLADLKEKQLPLNDFMARAELCLTNRTAVQPPYNCYGNQFAVTVDSAGKISTIHQMFRP
ncbi:MULTISPECIES: hypothetical protein [unclassified Kitasatospora]|uniref:hypothetical protein n=1 Tax=unclassified Kitasatospora TaxID=2633591 RepID=UPI000710EE7E|nr:MULTISPECIES: hypothetical protein [unclassified Kitasatospora]KQV17554.1 hypothetical protein ASC99_25650 [Kitasatospora sp. Root107]KRB74287.1 hypothetical protein ASE03_17325 [Kitasatospora sp. Root187]